MKILHTADWHIGKRLHKYELSEEFDLFVQWLEKLIIERGIEVVLIAGDIFDSSNPSAQARKQFYQTLVLLYKLNCRVIITSGNHDSSVVLNAPKDLFNELNISVVGNLPDDITQCIFPIENALGEIEVVVVAIPFLKDSELLKFSENTSHESRLQTIQEGIERIFTNAWTYCKTQYPNIPSIAMGHLYTSGEITTSESERDIQIGNQARFEIDALEGKFDYIALGHIHKPQRIKSKTPILYSGSPIALSFSERNDLKRIILLDTQKGFEPESITIPSFRKLITLRGNLHEIKMKLANLHEALPLVSLLEIQLVEPIYSAQIEDDFTQLVTNFHQNEYEIVKTKMIFEDRLTGSSDLFELHQQLSDIKPQEVFAKLLENQPYDKATRQELFEAFSILLEQANELQ